MKREREVVDLSGSPPAQPKNAKHSDEPPQETAIVKRSDNDSSSSNSNNNNKLARGIDGTKWKPYYMLSSPMLPSCPGLTFGDLLSGDFTAAVLLNYMIDIEWMVSSCPKLLDPTIPVCVLHGEKGSAHSEKMKFLVCAEMYNWTCSEVDLYAERYGTHHSKAAILFYPAGVRVIITTANFIESDFLCRTQGVYVQDFPLKKAAAVAAVHEFEEDLISYLSAVAVKSRDTEYSYTRFVRRLREYDFSEAEVVLVGSVPGRHSAEEAKWGHLKLARSIRVAEEPLKVTSAESATPSVASTILLQYSSLGSMGKDGGYLTELTDSLCGGDNACCRTELVWPTVDCVRKSLQGYSSGGSLPCNSDLIYEGGVMKSLFSSGLCRWQGYPVERHSLTPHMKCYFKYRQIPAAGETGSPDSFHDKIQLDWFFLTSMNLSQAAWGVLQSNKTKLYIKSYELGVLFLPQRVHRRHRSFSCTPSHPLLGIDTDMPSNREAGNITLGSSDLVLEIPFVVPPLPYSPSDVPWTWDRPHLLPDRFGNLWNPGC